MSRNWLRAALLVPSAALVQIACALNPQPIPPGDDDFEDNAAEGSSSGAQGSSGGRGGSSSGGRPATPMDGGFQDGEGGLPDAGTSDASTEQDAGDAGAPDAGDAGDLDASAND